MLVSYGIWRPTWFCCVALLGFAVLLRFAAFAFLWKKLVADKEKPVALEAAGA